MLVIGRDHQWWAPRASRITGVSRSGLGVKAASGDGRDSSTGNRAVATPPTARARWPYRRSSIPEAGRVPPRRDTCRPPARAASSRARATARYRRDGGEHKGRDDAAASGQTRRPNENALPHERLEVLERQRVVVGVERDLVPVVGELRREVEPRLRLRTGHGRWGRRRSGGSSAGPGSPGAPGSCCTRRIARRA